MEKHSVDLIRALRYVSLLVSRFSSLKMYVSHEKHNVGTEYDLRKRPRQAGVKNHARNFLISYFA